MNPRFPWISSEYRERLLNMAMCLPLDGVVGHYSGQPTGSYDREGLVRRFLRVFEMSLVYDHHIDVVFYHRPTESLVRYLDHDNYVSVTLHSYQGEAGSASLDALLRRELKTVEPVLEVVEPIPVKKTA